MYQLCKEQKCNKKEISLRHSWEFRDGFEKQVRAIYNEQKKKNLNQADQVT